MNQANGISRERTVDHIRMFRVMKIAQGCHL
jgi:hypothetical protein